MANEKAPEGQVWVCCACGKTSEWRYGFDDNDKVCVRSCGWDESCMMNSALAYKDKLKMNGNLVVEAGPEAWVPEQ
jgi:hypothetical protein